MPFPVRRVLAGFVAGTTAGWFAGLLRTPARPAPDSSAGSAARLPQREFGDPAGADAGLPPGVQEDAPDPTPRPAVAEPAVDA
ncbi:MAG TPA: hypothetical protein VNA14_00745 [Mycobacteriales bacterium]|nr:hypothetical protein [Mycobacteriales bacterium]